MATKKGKSTLHIVAELYFGLLLGFVLIYAIPYVGRYF